MDGKKNNDEKKIAHMTWNYLLFYYKYVVRECLEREIKYFFKHVNLTNFFRNYKNYLAECKTWTWIIARACSRVGSTADFAWRLLDWLMTCSSCFRRILKYGLNDIDFNTNYILQILNTTMMLKYVLYYKVDKKMNWKETF